MKIEHLKADFEGWKLPDGRVLAGKYTIEIQRSRAFRYVPRLLPTKQEFYDGRGTLVSFPESKLDAAKEFVRKTFETQLTEWA